MTLTQLARIACLAAAVPVVARCGGSSDSSITAPTASASATTTTTVPTSTTTSTLAGIYSKFTNGVQVSMDGATVVLRTTDVPDHNSPYFGVGNAGYEAPQAGMQVAPGRIATQNLVFRVPSSPAVGTSSDTPLGPTGIATNGVALFNQYAAGRVPLGNEIFSFDRFNGHPTPNNQYHYHVEPLWLTAKGKSAFIGVLLDGFPVYGPQDEDGSTPGGLDTCNGHVHATSDFPQGIYHYHIVSAPPYISGCFRGAPGTVAG